MYKISLNCKPGKFYGTFVAIYSVLNVVAFIILISTTKWEVLMDDEADGFCIDNCFSYGNVNLLLNLLAPVITPLIYASVLYLSIFISREKENPTI
jgi:hypothetical protein